MSSANVKTNHIYNGLYLVLADHFPAYRTAYKALRRDSLTLVIAVSIIKFSRSEPKALPLVWSDLLPFVLPQFEAFGVLPGATESPSEVDDILG